MGRRGWTTRLTVESCFAFDVASLHGTGVFRSVMPSEWHYYSFSQETCLHYRVAGMAGRPAVLTFLRVWNQFGFSRDLDCSVRLSTTSCNFGERRYWLHCPATRNGRLCFRRVRILYLPTFGDSFGCRRCHDLTYESTRRSKRAVAAQEWWSALLLANGTR
jgi:hypothetical protein